MHRRNFYLPLPLIFFRKWCTIISEHYAERKIIMDRKASMLTTSFLIGGAVPYVYREMSRLEVSRYKITSSVLPEAFDGLKTVQLSDLHNKVFGNGNSQLVKLVSDEKPDMIFMTGDMVSHNAPHIQEFLKLAENLSDIAQVYYVNGNHELSDLDDETFDFVTERLKDIGAVCLDNDRIYIERGDSRICLCGLCYTAEYYRGVREYKHGWKAFSLTDMINYLGIKDPEVYTILLAHNPLDFDVHAEWGADISFGGHVHGGAVRLPLINGVLSPERKLMPKYKEGVYRINDSFLVANRGLGRLRINNPPEIVSVTLYSAK